MRIRQVKPEFWKDPDVSALAPFTRLTYIGLWMLADDAGWFRHDVPTIALELYGWEPRAKRERAVTAALADLATAGRVVVHDCGHADIPTLTEHQRFGGATKRVYTVRNDHSRCSPQVPAGTRDDPPTPATFEVRNGMGMGSFRSGSSDARKRDEEPTEFQLRVPRPVVS